VISEDWLVSFCFLDLSIPLGICLKHVPKRAVILLDFLFGNPWAMRSFWLRQQCLSWHIFCGIRYASSERYTQLLISDLTHLEVNFHQKKLFWSSFLRDVFLTAVLSMQRGFITVTTRILDCDPFYPSFSLGEFDTARGEWHFIFPTQRYFPYGSPMCNLKKPLKFCHWPTLRIQSPSQMMIGVYNHLLRKVFRFHYQSQKVIGSLGQVNISFWWKGPC